MLKQNQKKEKNNNNNLSLPPLPPSSSPGHGAFIPPPPPSPFQPYLRLLIHFNRRHQDLIILLEFFIFQHNFPLQILVRESKDCLETYFAHRCKPSPEKKNRKNLFRTVSNKNWISQFTNYQIYQKLELGYGLLNSLSVKADDILEQKFVIKNNKKMQSLNRSRKIIVLMKLKMSLIKVLSFTSLIVSMMEKIVISIKHFYQNFNTNENFYLLNRTIRQPQNQN